MTDLKDKTVEELIKLLRQHALPDPHDEREVLHAPLLTDAADRLEEAQQKIVAQTSGLSATESLLSEHKRKHEWWRKEASRLAAELDEAQKRDESKDAEVAAKALEEVSRTFPLSSSDVRTYLENKAAEYRAKAGRNG